jgi:hypothetical protein
MLQTRLYSVMNKRHVATVLAKEAERFRRPRDRDALDARLVEALGVELHVREELERAAAEIGEQLSAAVGPELAVRSACRTGPDLRVQQETDRNHPV